MSAPQSETSLSDHKSIALIGARGAGKSRLSRKLGKKLNLPVFSTDTQICFAANGKTIQQIVAEEGWPGFRQREFDILSKIAEMESSIIDCGGGILVEAPENPGLQESFSQRKASILKAHCTVVYIKRPMSWLLDKVKETASRPDLKGEPYEDLLNRRLPWYEQVADITLEADATGTKDLLAAILEHPLLQSRTNISQTITGQ
ncbi:MAG: shikimate kinase [Spirochaetaceae bacterium]|nr:shikimate kinase [Spirochaetaceae bacterium]|tara:strand:+ start:10539 stop:11147 length:609 start_codon:yes stop_codon:yes gene_type:complete